MKRTYHQRHQVQAFDSVGGTPPMPPATTTTNKEDTPKNKQEVLT